MKSIPHPDDMNKHVSALRHGRFVMVAVYLHWADSDLAVDLSPGSWR